MSPRYSSSAGRCGHPAEGIRGADAPWPGTRSASGRRQRHRVVRRPDVDRRRRDRSPRAARRCRRPGSASRRASPGRPIARIVNGSRSRTPSTSSEPGSPPTVVPRHDPDALRPRSPRRPRCGARSGDRPRRRASIGAADDDLDAAPGDGIEAGPCPDPAEVRLDLLDRRGAVRPVCPELVRAGSGGCRPRSGAGRSACSGCATSVGEVLGRLALERRSAGLRPELDDDEQSEQECDGGDRDLAPPVAHRRRPGDAGRVTAGAPLPGAAWRPGSRRRGRRTAATH